MTSANPIPQAVIGCDVGKTSIVVFDSRGGGTRTIPNQPQPLAILAAGLDATYLVVCEATGGYEALLLDALAQAGRPAHRADARKVKAFIRSFGTLGKTDAIDARAHSLATARSATPALPGGSPATPSATSSMPWSWPGAIWWPRAPRGPTARGRRPPASPRRFSPRWSIASTSRSPRSTPRSTGYFGAIVSTNPVRNCER